MSEEKVETMEVAGLKTTYSKYFGENFEVSGVPKGYQLEKLMRNPQDNIRDIVKLARYHYNKHGIIMRVINITRDFGATGYDLEYPTKSKAVRSIIEKFCDRVDLQQVTRDMVFELGLTGNLAGYNRGGNRIDIYPISKVQVSPLIVDNKPVLYYENDFMEAVADGPISPELERQLLLSHPYEVAKGIAKGDELIELDVKNTFFYKVNSSRYEKYGVPFILPALDEIAHKTLLKEAERSTATDIIEKILRISVGDDKAKTKVSANEIQYYHSLFEGKKGSLKVTVPYFVNAEWIEPSTDIFGKGKFEQVDNDILNALGISLTLIRGQGNSTYAEGYLSVSGLIRTIENMRSGIPRIIEDWFRQELIRRGRNPEHAPKFRWEKIEVDPSSKMELIRWLFQTAGLPYEVLYKEAGYDYMSVKLMREQENEEKIEDVFSLRDMPFQGDSGGRPKKDLHERLTDPKQSNNDTPRPSVS